MITTLHCRSTHLSRPASMTTPYYKLELYTWLEALSLRTLCLFFKNSPLKIINDVQNLNIEYWPEGYCLRSYPLALRHLMDGAADIDSPAEISSSMLYFEEFLKLPFSSSNPLMSYVMISNLMKCY